MALDQAKRKTISPEAVSALAALELGAKFNTLSIVARELIELGLACEDWGQLGITEAGRRFFRRHTDGLISRTYIPADGGYMAELSDHMVTAAHGPIDPMMSPQHIGKAVEIIEIVQEAPIERLPSTTDFRAQCLRAAGEASGKTGLWPHESWVEAFVESLASQAEET